jgi:hypothetical protein
MSKITVPRADLTTEQVAMVLRDRLGPGYNVLPGMVIGQTSFQSPREGRSNTIVVGTGGNRLVKAQVTITPREGQTELSISPGGVTWDLILNTFGVARKVRGVLANSRILSAL